MTHGLGRRFAPDERDKRFPMSAALPTASDRTYRYWFQGGWWGDQGSRPWCVAYAWLHFLEDGPTTHPELGPVRKPRKLYCRAQALDEWEGDCANPQYDGTSVRAGAKVLQNWGHIGEYLWAQSMDDITLCLLEQGPVVVGTAWYDGMFSPDANGFVYPTGSIVGGHAYKLDGINTAKGIVRAKNSWGREWGDAGRFWMDFEVLERLIFDEWGEACLALEVFS